MEALQRPTGLADSDRALGVLGKPRLLLLKQGVGGQGQGPEA